METRENTGKLLLHACCGPCSLEPVRLLREARVQPVLYYANSNIYPPEEYGRRLDTIRAWAEGEGLQLEEGAYCPEAWEATAGKAGDAAKERFGTVIHEAQPAPARTGEGADGDADAAVGADAGTAAIAGDAGVSGTPEAPNVPADSEPAEAPSSAELARQARCRACYRQRFAEAARFAAENGYGQLGTTLSVSPYQYTAIIEEELCRAAEAHGLEPLFSDYRPYYDAATQRSREKGMYRQNYCGCRFSAEEAQAEREQRKQLRAQARRARLEQTADARAQEEDQRQRNREEKRVYQLKQQRKRAILKSLREARS